MKKTTYGIILTMVLVLVFGFTGCSEIEEAIDKYNEDDKIATSTSATIKYSNGSKMGVTRAEDAPVDGGFNIYSIGTGAVVGFIGADAVVNNAGGRDLGVCAGATVSDSGVSGDCTIPTEDPASVLQREQQATATAAASQPAPSADQVYSSTPPGCEDRRDGTFDVSWDQQTCNAHGYFYCTLNNICTDQTINIAECL